MISFSEILLYVSLFLTPHTSVYAYSSSCELFTSKPVLLPSQTHKEVTNLQKLLNLDTSTQVAISGPGSPGMETSKYGRGTLLAIKRFQEKYSKDILIPNGLSKGTGLFGPSTQKKLQSLYCLSQESIPVSTSTTITLNSLKAKGELSANQTSCIIPKNGTTCVVDISWNSVNTSSPKVKQGDVTFSEQQSSKQNSRGVSYGTTIFTLSDSINTLAIYPVTASCAPDSGWNGWMCEDKTAQSQPATTLPVTNPVTTKIQSPLPGQLLLPVIPAFANGTKYYFDSANGNDTYDGLSPEKAKKNILSNSFLKPKTVLLLKKGSTVTLSANLYPEDVYIGTYDITGSGKENEKATLIIEPGKVYGIGANAGELMIENIHIIGNEVTKANTAGIGATKVTKLTAKNNTIESFSNGIVFAGNNGVISGNIIKNVYNNGIFAGSRLYGAPNNYEISNNDIDASQASNDGITLHDGIAGAGYGNSNNIYKNHIYGTPRENGIDIQSQYKNTIVAENTIHNTASYAIITDHGYEGSSGTVIKNNIIYNTKKSAIATLGDNEKVTGNILYNLSSDSGASAFWAQGTNKQISDNLVQIESSNIRATLLLNRAKDSPIPSGIFSRNTIVDKSNQMLITFFTNPDAALTSENEYVTGWSIENNHYYVTDTAGNYFPGKKTFTTWKSSLYGGATKDTNSTIAPLSDAPRVP